MDRFRRKTGHIVDFHRFRGLAAAAACAFCIGLASSDARSDTVAYTYDPLGRISKVEYGDGSRITFSYDASGNRTAVQTISTEGNKRAAALMSIIQLLLLEDD